MFNLENDKNSITIKHNLTEEVYRIIELKYFENEKYFLLQGINSEYAVYKYDTEERELRKVTNNKIISQLFGNIDSIFNLEMWFEKKIFIIPILILLIYPLSELIIWVFAHILPLIWSNTFSTAGVTEFATKYFPYSYHPDLKWYSHFAINIMYLFVSVCGVVKYLDNNYDNTENRIKLTIIPAFLIALILLYAIFNQDLYNTLEPYALWGFIPFVILTYKKVTG